MKKKPAICNRLQFYRTPGRLDFTLDFISNNSCRPGDERLSCGHEKKTNCFGVLIHDLSNGCKQESSATSLPDLDLLIDRVDTTIGYCPDS